MGNRPFLLRPSGKDYLWGGGRLNDEFAKNIAMYPLAETWECSTHPDGPSYAASGEFAGMSLSEVLKLHPEFLGQHTLGFPAESFPTAGSALSAGNFPPAEGSPPAESFFTAGKFPAAEGFSPAESSPTAGSCPPQEGELPILIKFIDAREKLSVQVHPTDSYAREHENGQRGKTEMWYVLDAARDAKLIYGLKRDCDESVIRRAIADGTVEKYLQKVPVRKDDVFLIEAGTIHAIGAGILIAEIQENSNLTYRLYDYGRTDKNGRQRELHVEKALAVADLKSSAEPRQPLRVLNYRQGAASELLCRCKYFETRRMLVNTERRQTVHFQSDALGYRILLCIGGCGTISFENDALKFYKGDCLFVPADSMRLDIHGQARFLDVRG